MARTVVAAFLGIVTGAAVAFELAPRNVALRHDDDASVAVTTRTDRDALDATVAALVRTAESDPRSAIAVAAALPTESARRVALTRLGTMLARGDPLEAIAAADAIGSQGLRESYEQVVLETWLDAAPEEVLALSYADPVEDAGLFSMRGRILPDEGRSRFVQRRVAETNPEATRLLGTQAVPAESGDGSSGFGPR